MKGFVDGRSGSSSVIVNKSNWLGVGFLFMIMQNPLDDTLNTFT